MSAPQPVWVLSEESPFDDPEASGGCVCGVFATAVAALYALATWEIGAAALAQITWTSVGPGSYEGRGYRDAVYILRNYQVDEEHQLRLASATEALLYGVDREPEAVLSPHTLAAALPPWEEDAGDEAP